MALCARAGRGRTLRADSHTTLHPLSASLQRCARSPVASDPWSSSVSVHPSLRANVFWCPGRGEGISTPRSGQCCDLIVRWVERWFARYGHDEVRYWLFEVWNGRTGSSLRNAFGLLLSLPRHDARGTKCGLAPVGRGPATSNFVPDNRSLGETKDTNEHAIMNRHGQPWAGRKP